MLEHALNYADEDVAVFPCLKSKAPATANGFHDATTDERQIKDWWTSNPDALIGAAVPEGIVIIDVDPRNGGDNTVRELVQAGCTFPRTRRARTGSGGFHYWYALPTDFNDALRVVLGPGVDVKRPGKGYVILPPSVSDAGPYEWLTDTEPVDMPEWMLERLRKGVVKRDVPDEIPGLPPYMPATDYGAVSLKRIGERLCKAEGGERNEALNRAAFSVGQLVAGGQLRESAGLADLTLGAELIGLPKWEAERTIESGYEAGLESPWVPDGPKPSQAPSEPMKASQIAPQGSERAFWTRWDVDEPSPPFYLDPLLPQNAYVLVYGATEAAKSMVWNALLAQGSHHGIRSSVYSLENPAHVDRNRLRRLGPDPDCFRITHEPLDLNDHLQVAGLVEREKAWGTDVVLLDTYSHAFNSRSEDGNAKAVAFAQVVRHIMHEVGCTVVVIDHTGYTQREEPRDASAKRQQVDVAVLMEKDGAWVRGQKARFRMTNFKAARFANPFEDVRGAIADTDGNGLELQWASGDFASRWEKKA